ncbi:hypothetical protein AAG570_009356 [Ranatra chinensis]|uniref:Chorein N-terminal domain-containing protein n=1 Tax=Ranatra chinensis TaxID=642074 RepID=A0ABD0YNU4_9HEMI
MFRIESYIASHISGYIERYVKNFRKQDAQVSLWEGDGSLHNLDLDLEVLEQELNLPFSFVSGHVHDLLIHVPWTKCVMKLKTSGGSTAPQSSDRSQGTSGEETMTPPSYMSSLLHKVICNLSITCNNLILKYVEEDIVLSMNIKTLSLGSVNSKWASEFSGMEIYVIMHFTVYLILHSYYSPIFYDSHDVPYMCYKYQKDSSHCCDLQN